MFKILDIKWVPLIIRLVLSGFMLYFIYSETGPWTVAILALAVLHIELISICFGLHTKAIREIAKGATLPRSE